MSLEMVEGLRNATGKYRQVNVETSDPLSLIVLLYDGLIRFLNGARKRLSDGDMAYEECRKVRSILSYLMTTLKDNGSEIERNLRGLYFFMYKQVVLANGERNARKIEEILPIVQDLRSAWVELKDREGAGERRK